MRKLIQAIAGQEPVTRQDIRQNKIRYKIQDRTDKWYRIQEQRDKVQEIRYKDIRQVVKRGNNQWRKQERQTRQTV